MSVPVGDAVAIRVTRPIARRMGQNSQQYLYIYIYMSASRCLCLFAAPTSHLSTPPSLHCTSLSACRYICTRGWCATYIVLDHCGAHISTSSSNVIKQELTHQARDQARLCGRPTTPGIEMPLVLICSPSLWLTNLHRVCVMVPVIAQVKTVEDITG